MNRNQSPKPKQFPLWSVTVIFVKLNDWLPDGPAITIHPPYTQCWPISFTDLLSEREDMKQWSPMSLSNKLCLCQWGVLSLALILHTHPQCWQNGTVVWKFLLERQIQSFHDDVGCTVAFFRNMRSLCQGKFNAIYIMKCEWRWHLWAILMTIFQEKRSQQIVLPLRWIWWDQFSHQSHFSQSMNVFVMLLDLDI